MLTGVNGSEGGFSTGEGNLRCLGGEALRAILSDFALALFDCTRKGNVLDTGSETSLVGGPEVVLVGDGFKVAASVVLLRVSISTLHSSSETDSYLDKGCQNQTFTNNISINIVS